MTEATSRSIAFYQKHAGPVSLPIVIESHEQMAALLAQFAGSLASHPEDGLEVAEVSCPKD